MYLLLPLETNEIFSPRMFRGHKLTKFVFVTIYFNLIVCQPHVFSLSAIFYHELYAQNYLLLRLPSLSQYYFSTYFSHFSFNWGIFCSNVLQLNCFGSQFFPFSRAFRFELKQNNISIVTVSIFVPTNICFYLASWNSDYDDIENKSKNMLQKFSAKISLS